MSDSVLFAMNADDQLVYLDRREAELMVHNPHLLYALRIADLRSDQRTALFQALEILNVPRQLSRAAVANAAADLVSPFVEAVYIGNVRWTQAVSPIACLVGDPKERRDAVKRRICLALRTVRLASSQ